MSQEKPKPTPVQITRIDLSIVNMMDLMIRLCIAAIPAGFILGFFSMFFGAFLGAFL